MASCNICGKPLTDPISIELGIGPICYVKKKLQEAMSRNENLFAPRAEYEYGTSDGVLWIRDVGGYKSVTNDMENVLADILKEMGRNMMEYFIIYQDSMRIWDGVQITNISTGKADEFRRIKFSFFSVNERDFEKAKLKLLSKLVIKYE